MPVLTNDADELGIRVCKTFKAMQDDRTNWENYWDDLSRFYVPKKDNVYGQRINGDRREDYLFDNTSVHANEMLASALHTFLTNSSSIWFGLSTGDDVFDHKDEVQSWLQNTVMVLLNVINNSNFDTEIHEYYLDLPSFSTAVFRVEEDKKDIIRNHARPIYEHYIAENNLGIVDTVYRKFEWSAIQIKQEYGEEVFDTMEMKDILQNKPDMKLCIIHALEPKSRYTLHNPGKITKPFRSVYVLEKNKRVLSEEGFRSNPYIVSRWTKLSGEVYGRGPGMKALADVKMLNSLMKVIIQSAQLTAAPPFQVPNEGVLLPLKLRPYGTNIYKSGSKDRIEPLMTNVRPDIAFELLQGLKSQIEQAFFIDQLRLAEKRPEMTATEVMQRSEENMRFLSPIIGRQRYEFADPFINRVYQIVEKRGMLPEMPPMLADAIASGKKNIQIRYTSPLARAQKSNEADSFIRMLQTVSPILEMQPETMQNIDGDAAVRLMSNYFGVHHLILKDWKDVLAMREQMSAMQEQQMALEQGQMASQIQKNIGQ